MRSNVDVKKYISYRPCQVSKSSNFLFQSETRKFSRPSLVLSFNNEDCKNSKTRYTLLQSPVKTASRGFV